VRRSRLTAVGILVVYGEEDVKGSYAAFGINRKCRIATVQSLFLLPLPAALVHGMAVHRTLQGHIHLLRNQRQ
uniref:hypothetical protein n=1 Tax=Enterococcus faecium TaxID=1352 RepID=UPI0034E986FA